jgi:hypothetical protein
MGNGVPVPVLHQAIPPSQADWRTAQARAVPSGRLSPPRRDDRLSAQPLPLAR